MLCCLCSYWNLIAILDAKNSVQRQSASEYQIIILQDEGLHFILTQAAVLCGSFLSLHCFQPSKIKFFSFSRFRNKTLYFGTLIVVDVFLGE